jgi:hypothetical protein
MAVQPTNLFLYLSVKSSAFYSLLSEFKYIEKGLLSRVNHLLITISNM